jgi:outer membrane protein assembly factor BamB
VWASVIRRAKTVVAGVVVAVVLLGSISPSDAQDGVATGDVVVTQLDEGALAVVTPDGEATTLATGLEDPHGTAVLDDGSILIADPTQGEIFGVLGRFGDEPEPVAALEGVEALAVGPDGTVYATARVPGEVARVDIDAGTVETLASGLAQPYGIAAIDEGLVVVESGAARVIAVDPETGSTNLLAQETSGGVLIGVAVGPDRSLYVSDFSGDQILRFVFGAREAIATVDGPTLLAFAPASGDQTDDELLVAAFEEDALVRLGLDGEELGRTTVDGPFAPAAVPEIVAPPVSTTEAPSTTQIAGTTPDTADTAAGVDGESSESDAGVIVLVVGLVVIAAIVGGVWLFSRRRGDRDDQGGGPSGERSAPPMPSRTEPPARRDVPVTYEGACADERRAVADAETALTAAESATRERQLRVESTQAALDLATRAAREADRQLATHDRAVMEARAELSESQEAVNSAAEGLAIAKEQDTQSPPWRVEDLGLSAEGALAFTEFRAGEIGPAQLKIRWMASGDTAAIEQLSQVGRSQVPAAQGATAEVERATSELGRTRARVAQVEARYRKAQAAAQQARSDLAEAMRAADDARHEEERLAHQIEQTAQRLAAARDRLRTCREEARRNALDEARREEAEREAAERAALEERLIAGLDD